MQVLFVPFIISHFYMHLTVLLCFCSMEERGQFLEGASWFKKEGHLQEPLPMQLVFPMSPIHFKPIKATGKRLKNRYICPCYYYPARMGAFVVAVDLHSGKESSEFWVKRGTAMLCTLST